MNIPEYCNVEILLRRSDIRPASIDDLFELIQRHDDKFDVSKIKKCKISFGNTGASFYFMHPTKLYSVKLQNDLDLLYISSDISALGIAYFYADGRIQTSKFMINHISPVKSGKELSLLDIICMKKFGLPFSKSIANIDIDLPEIATEVCLKYSNRVMQTNIENELIQKLISSGIVIMYSDSIKSCGHFDFLKLLDAIINNLITMDQIIDAQLELNKLYNKCIHVYQKKTLGFLNMLAYEYRSTER